MYLFYLGKGFLIEKNIIGEEEDAFVLLVCYMYLLSLMKHERFNPEKWFRLKLHWSKCASIEKQMLYQHSCICWYGLDLYSIKRTLLNGDKRKDMMMEYITANFSLDMEQNKHKPKTEVTEVIKRNHINKKISREGVKTIERMLKITIDI